MSGHAESAATLRDRALARLLKFPAAKYDGGLSEAAVMALMDAEREIDTLRVEAFNREVEASLPKGPEGYVC